MAMTNPHDGLVSFQEALDKHLINPANCTLHTDMSILHDDAEGTPRLTYALIENGKVKATVVGVIVEPIEGIPCVALGYAVAEQYRGQGLAKDVLRKSINELKHGFKKHMDRLYIESIVGADNIASQKLSEQYISPNPSKIIDEHSGLPALHYVKLLNLNS
ncbi:GNAT family N-acetyltransferase [Pantoea dispersa]|uniref:GNAT family N-acetyltransferase n=1 Tax=Pantoea dispersa TaxID=59814 RepID=UPI0032B5A9BE